MSHFEHLKSLLIISAEIHTWELEHLKAFDSIGGKILFSALLQNYRNQNQEIVLQVKIKSLYQDSIISDRTLRKKIKELYQLGYIEYLKPSNDLRIKCPKPSEKLVKIFHQYSNEINLVINKSFYIVPLSSNSGNFIAC